MMTRHAQVIDETEPSVLNPLSQNRITALDASFDLEIKTTRGERWQRGISIFRWPRISPGRSREPVLFSR